MLLLHILILRYPLPDGTLPVVVLFVPQTCRRSSSSRYVPFAGFPGGDTHCPTRILLTCPAQVHFGLLICSITSVTFVFSLTQVFVFLSRHAMFNILLSIFVCAAANVFFAWLVSAHVSAPYDIAWVVDLSLQACSSVTLEDVTVHGECCPSGRDSALNLLVLVVVSGAVSLSHVFVAFNVHDLVLLPYICRFL